MTSTAARATVHNSHPGEVVSQSALRRLVEAVLRDHNVEAGSISVILCDRQRHELLHRKYLDRDYPTDVLAFALGDDEALEGEVYVDLDTARERHDEFGAGFEEEVARYVVHGTLHLLGFNDDAPEGRATMREAEDRYVAQWTSGRF